MAVIGRGVIIRSLLWKFFERTSVQLIQFVITILLARILKPAEYGIIALIMVFISISQVIVDGGFNTALIQKKNADHEDYSTIFIFGLVMSLIMYIILYLSAPYIASYYSMSELKPVVRVVGILLFIYAINAVQNSQILRDMRFQELFWSSLFSVLVSGTVSIIMAYRGFGVWALVTQILLSQLVLTIVLWVILRWRPELIFSYDCFRGLFDYGWKIFMTNIVIAIFVNIRKLIIGKLFAPASLAYFDRGAHFPDLIMTNINGSIQAVLFPAFAKEQSDRVRVKQMLRYSTKMSCFAIYPLMMLLIVSAKPLVLFLLTEKWLPAVAFLQIFCIAYFFRPITIPNLEAIKALGYSDISLKLEIIKKVLDITILVVSVFYGIYAIAWGIVLFNFLCVFINLYPNKRLLDYGMAEQMKDALPVFLLTLTMGFVVYWIHFLEWPLVATLLTQYTTGILLYLFLCYIIKEESFSYILALVKNRLNNSK